FWLFVAASAVFILLNALLTPLTALSTLAGPRQVYLALVGIYYVAVSAANVVRRREDSVTILVGILAYAIGSRIELFWGLQFRDYSMGIFTLCMLFALVSRHARMQNRLIRLSSSLLDAHEEERRRIARDIHDSVGQSLLALKLRLQMLSSKGSSPGETLPPGTLDGLVKEASGIIEEVRRTSMDLRPAFIETMSLVEAIGWYAGAFMERSGIELNVLGGEHAFPDPPPRTRDNLYRALQEILTNARKHSRATRIDVSLFRSGPKLILEVTDNGRGIDLAGDRKQGIGLDTIRERAELLGGTCRVRGAPGRGTTITLEVPLQ
ncbi:MAG TPA: sensor histidine kinase, partial [Candidatus Deferrimicrobiaceae bacterium]